MQSYASISTVLCILGTLLAYMAVRTLYLRYKHPLLNIVALGAAAVITVLVVFDIPCAVYEPSAKIMTAFIGPATVALALPLYRYRHVLLRYALAIMGSVCAGTFVAMFSAGLLAKVGGLPQEVVISILPKSSSIPFAIEVAGMYGGIPSLTAAFVVATGTLGSLIGGWTLNLARVADPFARGLALGTVSHAQGTAAALQEGEEAGAMGGLALILAGIFTAALAPVAVSLLMRVPALG